MMSGLQENLIKLERKLQAGDKLIYRDICNYMEFEVIEVNRNLFLAVDLETGEVKERNLLNLQRGWDFEHTYLKELRLFIS